MSDPSILFDETTLREAAALIGLGRRGREMVSQLHQRLDLFSIPFLVSDEPAAWRDRFGSKAGTESGDLTVPDLDFSGCDIMGILIVGAEYHNPEVVRMLQQSLARDRPFLLLGIILPPPTGEPVRLDPRLRSVCDCLLDWPSDPVLPDDISRLALAASDWLSPVLNAGLICIDVADIAGVFGRGEARTLLMGSASAPNDQPVVAAHAVLANLRAQGFIANQCRGLLVVIRAGLDFTLKHLEDIDAVFQALPFPDAVTRAMSVPDDQESAKKSLIRVTAFAMRS